MALPGRAIAAAREYLGENQTEFGAHFGVGQAVVSEWEKEKSVPRSEHAEALQTMVLRRVTDLAEALGVVSEQGLVELVLSPQATTRVLSPRQAAFVDDLRYRLKHGPALSPADVTVIRALAPLHDLGEI